MIEVDCRKCKNCNNNKCIVYNTDNADVAVKNVPTITLQIISRRKMMAKTICKGVKIGEVPRRGKPSIEWHKNGKPQYYCYGWKNSMTDELLEVCRKCKDNVIYAQDDLDEWNKERRGVRE